MANEVVPPILDRACFGPLLTTPTVRDTVPPAVIVRLAERHFNDDWGDLPDEDEELNMNIINGIHNKDKEAEFGRIMSVYTWPGLLKKRSGSFHICNMIPNCNKILTAATQ